MREVDDYLKRAQIERDENWRELCAEIPFIKFPADWQVKPIPPFSGAVVRFLVLLPNGEDKSVYLDWYNKLGYYDGPYWEVYPCHGDTGRCGVKESDELLKLIATPGAADQSPASEPK